MLGFSAPALLWGTGAVLVPVAIHFWSHRPARVIRVGSIRLLAQTLPARARRLALTDLPLLLLRAGIVLAVALAAAGIAWQSRGAAPGDLALLDPALAGADGFTHLSDSLAAAGIERRWLAPGLPALDATVPTAGTGNVWPLLAEADARFGGRRLVVAAERTAARYAGPRPALASEVRWLPPLATARTPAAAVPPVRRVLLLTGRDREADARHADAALQALAATRVPGLEVQRLPGAPAESVLVTADAVIALGVPLDSARVANALRPGAVLLADSASWPRAPLGAPQWMRSSGEPALARSALGAGTLLQLRTRLRSTELPLVATAAFADSLGALLLPGEDALARQPLGDAQRTPAKLATPVQAGSRADLVPLFALLALAGFLVERLLARRRVP